MIQITPNQVTPTLRNLFPTDSPQAHRCFAVLDGLEHKGKIITDDPINPTWAIAREAFDGGIFLGGKLDKATVENVTAMLRKEDEILICIDPDDPHLDLLPPDPYYEGWAIDFYDRPIGEGLDQYISRVPDGMALRRLDRDLIIRTQWGPDDVKFHGGLDIWEQTCFGYCLMQGDDILSEATVGPAALGLREPGVITYEDHRGKGYGTMVSARLVQEIESLGDKTYWNCAKQNVSSAAIARKLGYTIEREFRVIAWKKLGMVQK